MSSGCRSALLIIALLLGGANGAAGRDLRVCADPNNMPFSNNRGEGMENKIVELIAQELGAMVQYTWRAQRRGFVRNTLNAGACDLVAGTAEGIDMLRTTAPYYRSTYVFVSRPDLSPIMSLDDPRLRTLKIGVHLIGDDGYNVPPAHALARRGIVENVRGFSLYGDYRQESPPARLIDAVVSGEIDVAIAWGPLGGYYAALQDPPLQVSPVRPQRDDAFPMTYAIAMGVRRSDKDLLIAIDQALGRKRHEIEAVLTRFHVPQIEPLDNDAGGMK
jgi:mxaJ protein